MVLRWTSVWDRKHGAYFLKPILQAMNQLEERIFDDIGRCFTSTPYLLMGDADWFDLAKGLDTQVHYTSGTPWCRTGTSSQKIVDKYLNLN